MFNLAIDRKLRLAMSSDSESFRDTFAPPNEGNAHLRAAQLLLDHTKIESMCAISESR